MALVKKQMTPEQWALTQLEIARNLSNVRPIMSRFGKRYQKSSRKNLRSGKQATGRRMPGLSDITKQGQVVAEDDKTRLGPRSSGRGPLNATGKMVRGLVYATIRNGFILLNKNTNRAEVSGWHTKELKLRVTRSMQRHLAKVHDIKVRIGTVLFRPARIPFALNSRQVKRSVGDLNKFILGSLLK